jgi:hypothetical protein
MCRLQSVHLQTWTIFPTLMTWWLILHCSYHIRFHWIKTQFCVTFRVSCRPYPVSSMGHRLSWHTPFSFKRSKLVLYCIFGHTLSKYHPTNRIPMTSQTKCFAISKFYLRSVHPNHPVKKTKPACSPWNIISLIICKTPQNCRPEPFMRFYAMFWRIITHDDFRGDTVVVHHRAHDGGGLRTTLDRTYSTVCITVCNTSTVLYDIPFNELVIDAHPSICQCVGLPG